MRLNIEIGGMKEIKRHSIQIKNYPKRYNDEFLDEAGEVGRRFMKLRVPKGVRPNGLSSDIIHHRANRNTELIRFNRLNNKLIGAFNQFGVAPFYRNVYHDPELLRWVQMKIPSFLSKGGRLLLIGGPRSRIRTGASKNTFIDETVRDITNAIPEIAKTAYKRSEKYIR